MAQLRGAGVAGVQLLSTFCKCFTRRVGKDMRTPHAMHINARLHSRALLLPAFLAGCSKHGSSRSSVTANKIEREITSQRV